MKTSNRNCRELVNRFETFKASHLFSERSENLYVVYSYGYHFPMWIAVINPVSSVAKWYGNKDKYSVSTSRHASQSRPSGEIEYLSTDGMKAILFSQREAA